MHKIDIKPLSVNQAWKGKRYKTDKYLAYEAALMFILPKIEIPDPPYKVELKYGFSSKNSDIDNPCKNFIDVLQKKYGFNDRDIYKLIQTKEIVPKGKEYIKFNIETWKN